VHDDNYGIEMDCCKVKLGNSETIMCAHMDKIKTIIGLSCARPRVENVEGLRVHAALLTKHKITNITCITHTCTEAK